MSVGQVGLGISGTATVLTAVLVTLLNGFEPRTSFMG